MTSCKPQGLNFSYIDIDAIDNRTNTISKPKEIASVDAPSRATRKLQIGDTLFSMVRPYLRNIAYVSDKYSDCIASTGFFTCRPNDAINPQYLFYLLTSNYVVDGLNYYMKGDNSPSINNNNILDFYYPVPPISEQKRIVDKISYILATLKKIEESL